MLKAKIIVFNLIEHTKIRKKNIKFNASWVLPFSCSIVIKCKSISFKVNIKKKKLKKKTKKGACTLFFHAIRIYLSGRFVKWQMFVLKQLTILQVPMTEVTIIKTCIIHLFSVVWSFEMFIATRRKKERNL